MAKNQAFGDKTKKSSAKGKTYLKIIRTSKSSDSGGIRFNAEMVGVPPEENVDKFIKSYLDKTGKK